MRPVNKPYPVPKKTVNNLKTCVISRLKADFRFPKNIDTYPKTIIVLKIIRVNTVLARQGNLIVCVGLK